MRDCFMLYFLQPNFSTYLILQILCYLGNNILINVDHIGENTRWGYIFQSDIFDSYDVFANVTNKAPFFCKFVWDIWTKASVSGGTTLDICALLIIGFCSEWQSGTGLEGSCGLISVTDGRKRQRLINDWDGPCKPKCTLGGTTNAGFSGI